MARSGKMSGPCSGWHGFGLGVLGGLGWLKACDSKVKGVSWLKGQEWLEGGGGSKVEG